MLQLLIAPPYQPCSQRDLSQYKHLQSNEVHKTTQQVVDAPSHLVSYTIVDRLSTSTDCRGEHTNKHNTQNSIVLFDTTQRMLHSNSTAS